MRSPIYTALRHDAQMYSEAQYFITRLRKARRKIPIGKYDELRSMALSGKVADAENALNKLLCATYNFPLEFDRGET